MTGGITADADPRNQRLVIDISGRLDADEIKEGAERVLEEAERLRDGFDVITDLSRFKPPSPEAAEPIQEAQAELVELGMDRVVRVIDDETGQVVLTAFQRRSRKVGYSGETASTQDEAFEMLEEDEQAGYQTA